MTPLRSFILLGCPGRPAELSAILYRGPMRLVPLIAVSSLLAMSIAFETQSAPCPETQFTCRGTTQAVPGDRGDLSCPYDDNDGSSGSAAFDYPLGTARLSFSNTGLALAVADSFWFEGLAPGDSVRCRANLNLNGQVCSGDIARLDVTLSLTPGQTQEESFFSPGPLGCSPIARVIDQWVALRIGERFSMKLNLVGFDAAGGNGVINTALQFTELPPNVVVRSCHGFRQDGPVPARPSSWGSVKASYR